MSRSWRSGLSRSDPNVTRRGLIDDVTDGLVQIGPDGSGHGLVGTDQATTSQRYPECLPGRAQHSRQGVALDLPGDVELHALIEPCAVHLGVVIGIGKPLPPRPPTQPIPCLKHQHPVTPMSRIREPPSARRCHHQPRVRRA